MIVNGCFFLQPSALSPIKHPTIKLPVFPHVSSALSEPKGLVSCLGLSEFSGEAFKPERCGHTKTVTFFFVPNHPITLPLNGLYTVCWEMLKTSGVPSGASKFEITFLEMSQVFRRPGYCKWTHIITTQSYFSKWFLVVLEPFSGKFRRKNKKLMSQHCLSKKNKFGSSSQFLVVLLNFMAIFWRCQMHLSSCAQVIIHQPLQTPRRGPVHDPHGVHCWLPVRPPHNDLGLVAVWRYAPLLRSKFSPIMELSHLFPPKRVATCKYMYIYMPICTDDVWCIEYCRSSYR